jgi:hypothetical protein
LIPLDKVLPPRFVGYVVFLHLHKAGRCFGLAAVAVVTVYTETGFWFNDRHILGLGSPRSDVRTCEEIAFFRHPGENRGPGSCENL